MYSQHPIGTLEVDLNVIRRFDIKTPNYPLYPSIDYFIDAIDAATHASWANNRKIGGTRRPLSIYAHISHSAACYIFIAKIIILLQTRKQI